jgi:hypothetical protein
MEKFGGICEGKLDLIYDVNSRVVKSDRLERASDTALCTPLMCCAWIEKSFRMQVDASFSAILECNLWEPVLLKLLRLSQLIALELSERARMFP